jgi:hypothetical protein
METPTRRNFLKIAAVATLAPALPLRSRTARDITTMPLAVDLVGPMAFRKNQKVVDVWMPKLDQSGKKHEAGIGTSVTSIILPMGDYVITGPAPSASNAVPYPISNCKVYEDKPNDYSAADRYIHLTLPAPDWIVALDPVSAKIYPTNAKRPSSYSHYAVGLRFLYKQAGTPNLSPGGNIPFDPAPGETQLTLSIAYAPYDYNDSGHSEAKFAFNQLSKLFPNLDLQVDFETADMDKAPAKKDKENVEWLQYGGPLHNCKAPIILLD